MYYNAEVQIIATICNKKLAEYPAIFKLYKYNLKHLV